MLRCVPGGLAVFAWLLLASPAQGDAITAAPPGYHPVRHEVLVDLGPYAHCVAWTYVVKDGDTLGEIAQRELGSARRHREILALNPGVRPQRMQAGTRLAMPPRSPACARDDARFLFFAWTRDAAGWSAPRRLGGEEPQHLGDGARVFAVPYPRLDELLDASGERGLDGAVLDASPYVARSVPVEMLAWLPDGDPTTRLVTHYRIEDMEGRNLLIERTGEERYDDLGRRLDPPPPARRGPPTLLLVLSFALVVSLLVHGLARQARLRAETAGVALAGIADAEPEEPRAEAEAYEVLDRASEDPAAAWDAEVGGPGAPASAADAERELDPAQMSLFPEA